MKYQIEHSTGYQYSSPASLSQNELLLFPRETATQKVDSVQLEVQPAPQHLTNYRDFFGNNVHHFMVQHSHSNLSIVSTCKVSTSMPALPSAEATLPWEDVIRRLLAPQRCRDDLYALQFLYKSPFIPFAPDLRDYALKILSWRNACFEWGNGSDTKDFCGIHL